MHAQLVPALLPARLDLGRVVAVDPVSVGAGAVGRARHGFGGHGITLVKASGKERVDSRVARSVRLRRPREARGPRDGERTLRARLMTRNGTRWRSHPRWHAADARQRRAGSRPGDDRALTRGRDRVGSGWWSDGGSNPGPSACHADALPAELSPQELASSRPRAIVPQPAPRGFAGLHRHTAHNTPGAGRGGDPVSALRGWRRPPP